MYEVKPKIMLSDCVVYVIANKIMVCNKNSCLALKFTKSEDFKKFPC